MQGMTIDYDQLQELIKEGKLIEALRMGLALFRDNTSNVNLWFEVANLCLQLDDRKTGVEGLIGAGRELAENGNLPMAIVCIRTIEEAGEDAGELTRHVSALFGKDSNRVRNRAMPVPPLPSTVDEATLAQVKGDKAALLAGAARVLMQADEGAKLASAMRSVHPPVPYFPLFGMLSADNFTQLVSCFSPKRFYRDELLIKQGDASSDFYLVARGEVKVFIAEKIQDEGGMTQQMRFKHVATLGPGTFVGEMGIVARTPRSANVQAVSGGTLLGASLESIEKLAAEIPEVADIIVAYCEVRLLENVMAASPILLPIESEDERAAALRHFERLYVPSGNIIIREGQPASGIYVVVSGEVGVTKLGAPPDGVSLKDSQTGKMIFITALSSGDIVGEISTVMKKPATATVHAITDTSLLFLPKERFMEFTKTYPGVFQRIYEIVESREEDIAKILSTKAAPGDDLL